ncbi:GNAT family N-acetyltransferase [Qipengyuania sp.]|uniref:GNAT family N-acetyltransferase n=1 Tax=Qipengyuania sp. TaxID=2004515 RepID=UPI0035C86356
MATIVPLSAIEPPLVEELLDAAFGDGRHARTAYRIRTGMDWLPALSFAALDDDDYLVASIQLWPVALTDADGRPHPLLMVGPVAVAPGRQGEGYGKALMATSLGAISGKAPLPQVLIGDLDYYGRWGFSAEHTGGWRCPGPWDRERLLVRCENPAVLPREGMLGPWSEAPILAPQTRAL